MSCHQGYQQQWNSRSKSIIISLYFYFSRAIWWTAWGLLSRVYTIRDATRHDATRRDAIWRDIQVLFTLCATSSRAVTWQQGIWDPEQIKLCNLNRCFDPTWHCVYLTDIPPKNTSICITQPHKHITWNTNSSHCWVLIKVCWGVNPGCVNSTSHVTLNQAS